jgi:hypothetical protein
MPAFSRGATYPQSSIMLLAICSYRARLDRSDRSAVCSAEIGSSLPKYLMTFRKYRCLSIGPASVLNFVDDQHFDAYRRKQLHDLEFQSLRRLR